MNTKLHAICDSKGRGYLVEPRVYFAQKAFQDINPLFVGNPDEDQYGAMLRVEKRKLHRWEWLRSICRAGV
ncbi:hypothetical protein RUA4292_03149 [Ruegeria atlantica]|uniref:Uncharacterized protein n=1 Tax=Ruegeria atlantica TaxID=81569 RepID=A0A0P1F1Z0_9RHOB|nr:hypothetical protein RUA4292_03149 [Ruegeria atlantica]